MSFEATRKAWGADCGGNSKLVLLCLADFYNEVELVSWPGITRIAFECGINRTTVMAAIKDLEGHHFVTVDRSHGARHLYKLNWSEIATSRKSRPVENTDDHQSEIPTSTSRKSRHNPIKEPINHPIAVAGGGKASTLRARSPLFDSLAIASGQNLDELTKSAAGAIAKALSEIRNASPDVTVEEIQRRAANYRALMPNAVLTAMALAKHWGSLGSTFTPAKSPKPKWKQLDDLKAMAAKHPGNWSNTGIDPRSITQTDADAFKLLKSEIVALGGTV